MMLEGDDDDDDDEYYFFDNARSPSGDTVDGITGIQSGCIPLNDKQGWEMALNVTLGTAFKRAGYDTASFSSRDIDKTQGTKYFMMYNQLAANFDTVVGSGKHNDIVTVSHFNEWIKHRSAAAAWNGQSGGGDVPTRRPFFAQFYFGDAHYPFYNTVELSNTTERVPGMFASVDKTLERIFTILKDDGQLKNTVVLGVADHGDNVIEGRMESARLIKWNSGVMNPIMYMHVPKNITTPTVTAASSKVLRHNTKKLVSILDVYPTLLHLLGESFPTTDEHCIRGVNLFDRALTDDRVAWSIPGASRDLTTDEQGNVGIHIGTASSLVNRFGYYSNGLKVHEYRPNAYYANNNNKTGIDDAPIQAISEWKSLIMNLTGTACCASGDSWVWRTRSLWTNEFLKSLDLKWDAAENRL
ncbi:MAG: hypothetical protein SGARI_002161, partial [Bacillariaceae sp.]